MQYESPLMDTLHARIDSYSKELHYFSMTDMVDSNRSRVRKQHLGREDGIYIDDRWPIIIVNYVR